jgi:hypothetical protein
VLLAMDLPQQFDRRFEMRFGVQIEPYLKVGATDG